MIIKMRYKSRKYMSIEEDALTLAITSEPGWGTAP
jgi:hypothetical protein